MNFKILEQFHIDFCVCARLCIEELVVGSVSYFESELR